MFLATDRLILRDFVEADIDYELDPQYWGYGYASEAAKADGSWNALDAVEALEIPPDLAEDSVRANQWRQKDAT